MFPLDSPFLPGQPMPLQVFEPRYIAMLRDVAPVGARAAVARRVRLTSPAPGEAWHLARPHAMLDRWLTPSRRVRRMRWQSCGPLRRRCPVGALWSTSSWQSVAWTPRSATDRSRPPGQHQPQPSAKSGRDTSPEASTSLIVRCSSRSMTSSSFASLTRCVERGRLDRDGPGGPHRLRVDPRLAGRAQLLELPDEGIGQVGGASLAVGLRRGEVRARDEEDTPFVRHRDFGRGGGEPGGVEPGRLLCPCARSRPQGRAPPHGRRLRIDWPHCFPLVRLGSAPRRTSRSRARAVIAASAASTYIGADAPSASS